MKKLATLLAATGTLALILVAFTPNAALAWGWRYYPCYLPYMYHYPYAFFPIGAVSIVGSATAGDKIQVPLSRRWFT